MLLGLQENAQPLSPGRTVNTSIEQRSSKLKWGLAPLAIVGGTALAAYFAGFNLATMAAAIFPQGTWLFSALTAVGTLGSVGASAAMVAGGLLSVAVIRLSAVLIVSMVSRNSESEDQQTTVRQTAPAVEADPEEPWNQLAQNLDADMKQRNDRLMKTIGEMFDKYLEQLSTPIDYTDTAAEQKQSTPSTDGSSPLLMIEDRPTMSP